LKVPNPNRLTSSPFWTAPVIMSKMPSTSSRAKRPGQLVLAATAPPNPACSCPSLLSLIRSRTQLSRARAGLRRRRSAVLGMSEGALLAGRASSRHSVASAPTQIMSDSREPPISTSIAPLPDLTLPSS
jgi:hypothetical protein